MHNSSLEQRVALIQNIREISANNEKTINNIHSVVSNSSPIDRNLQPSKSKFKYRMIAAVIIFGIYVLVDFQNLEVMGHNAKEVKKMIEYNIDYEEILKQVNTQLTNVTSIE